MLERLVLWLFLEMDRRRRKGRFFEFGCEGQENCYDDKLERWPYFGLEEENGVVEQVC